MDGIDEKDFGRIKKISEKRILIEKGIVNLLDLKSENQRKTPTWLGTH